jgi:GTP-binding protein
MHVRSAQFVKSIRGTNDILYDGVPQIAFVGRSNVGKSSMINTLVRSQTLVKTGKKPGKTTEINFFLVNKQVYFVDLPGYGYAAVPQEEREQIRRMIIWYLTESKVRPACVVLIIDCKIGITEFDKTMLALLRDMKHPHVVVANKVDKLTPTALRKQLDVLHIAAGETVWPFSARLGKGADDLIDQFLTAHN